MFNYSVDHVALIRKEKPVWQKGRLNGIGGKIENGESSEDAMIREFAEETGYATTLRQWDLFCRIGDNATWRVDFYTTVGDLHRIESMEVEQVEIIKLDDVWRDRAKLIGNLQWLIPMAVDFLCSGGAGPIGSKVDYAK